MSTKRYLWGRKVFLERLNSNDDRRDGPIISREKAQLIFIIYYWQTPMVYAQERFKQTTFQVLWQSNQCSHLGSKIPVNMWFTFVLWYERKAIEVSYNRMLEIEFHIHRTEKWKAQNFSIRKFLLFCENFIGTVFFFKIILIVVSDILTKNDCSKRHYVISSTSMKALKSKLINNAQVVKPSYRPYSIIGANH